MVHVIKVYLDDEKNERHIRRLAVSSDVISSFPLLKEKIQALFQLPTVIFDVKWKDSENDEILMSSDGELAQALANADDGLLKLFVNFGQSIPKVQQTEAKSAHEPKATGELHPHVVCDACNGSVCGDRYKCLQCKDFDLCASCSNANKHPYHDMIKLVKPSLSPRVWTFLGARKMWRSMFGHVPRGSFPFPSPTETSSSNEESQTHSPRQDIRNALHKLLNGDFVSAEKLFNEGLGSFLQKRSGDIGVKIETNPDRFPREKCSKNKNDKKEAEQTCASDKATEANENIAAAEEKIETQPPEWEEINEQKNVDPTQVCGIFADFEKNYPEVKKAEYASGNEVKSSDTGEREKSPVISDENSACAEGWTLLQKEEAEKTSMYPSLEKMGTQPGCSDQSASSIKPGCSDQSASSIKPGFSDQGASNIEPACSNQGASNIEPACSNQGASNIEEACLNQSTNNIKPECPDQGASNIEPACLDQGANFIKPDQGAGNFIEGNVIHTNDPEIINALIKMQAMGFTNEGGWLERLLVTKKGNINQALDALYPFTRQ